MEAQEKFAQFSTSELQAEVARRLEEARQASRDRQHRQFYRKVEQSFATERERAKFIASLPDDTDFKIKASDGSIYVLDRETGEELRLRLSRTASTFYDYDHWRLELYEDGKKVGGTGLYSDSDSYAAEWESRPYRDKWGKDCRFDPEWDLEEAANNLGYSAQPAHYYRL